MRNFRYHETIYLRKEMNTEFKQVPSTLGTSQILYYMHEIAYHTFWELQGPASEEYNN